MPDELAEAVRGRALMSVFAAASFCFRNGLTADEVQREVDAARNEARRKKEGQARA